MYLTAEPPKCMKQKINKNEGGIRQLNNNSWRFQYTIFCTGLNNKTEDCKGKRRL